MKRMILMAGVWLMGSVLSGLAGDVLTLSTGTKYEGIFDGFKNGSFQIRTDKGQTKKESASRVSKLELASPGSATVVLNNSKNPESLKFIGFEKSTFKFDKDGTEVTYATSKIKELRMEVDFSRVETTDANEVTVISNGEEVDLEKVVVKDKVNILHVHQPGLMQSDRQIPYLDELNSKPGNKGKVVVLRAVLKDENDPFAQKFGIKTFPQFWFYNRKGELVTRLIDRFTPVDFDEALKKAKK